MSATEGAPWFIGKSDLKDGAWIVLYPRMHQHRVRRHAYFDTHAEALAFVLAQPEVRRRTSSAAKARQRAAEALS